MAKAVCDELPAAKALFDKASEILGYDLLQVCAEVVNRSIFVFPDISVGLSPENLSLSL